MSEIKKTLGGDRVGAGRMMKVALHNFERSSHNLDRIVRTSAAPGVLIPILKEVMLPGDTFDLNLFADVKTHPTIAPLFGSFKLQIDVFKCDFRLYQGLLHNNKQKIGLNISQVKLPLLEMQALKARADLNENVNSSSLLKYLGISGFGYNGSQTITETRQFNAIPYLAYFDIYKNYYANKMEEIGVIVHTGAKNTELTTIVKSTNEGDTIGQINQATGQITPTLTITSSLETYVRINGKNFKPETVRITIMTTGTPTVQTVPYSSLFKITSQNTAPDGTTFIDGIYNKIYSSVTITNVFAEASFKEGINLVQFPLENLDNMREDILSKVRQTSNYTINENSIIPYNLPFQKATSEPDEDRCCMIYPMEGLLCKTYQSDIFNNWLNSEYVDNINEITAVSTEGGSFTIDALRMSEKVNQMLNRIAVSGGTYNDWIEAVYAHQAVRLSETPIYMGGMSQEIVFQEVISQSAAENQPLGSLAGKGRTIGEQKGGNMYIKTDEPCYIIAIASITPRIDYSQGNDWDMYALKTLDDLHKPNLDQIGFQDLITESMFANSTAFDMERNTWVQKAAGKQPAWINYMTSYNKCFGNFADEANEMFMTLNRRYEHDEEGNIIDLTTYIDPAKYNYVFAQTNLEAQNFWLQVGINLTARRKMSAKVMPNL